MAAAKIPGEDTTATAPVACSLTRAGLAEQAGRWARLAARDMTGRERTRHGFRAGFRPGAGTEEELRALAAAEAQCCPWATWLVHADGTQLVLEVRSAGHGVAALQAMFTGLRPAPAARQAGRPR
jgi:MerR family transcriptional regulator, copper efflux regulator